MLYSGKSEKGDDRMKYCPRCGSKMEKGSPLCPVCGLNTVQKDKKAVMQFAELSYDHTGEFSPEDISQNRLYAMLPYLLSIAGMIVALLAAPGSRFAAFHVRQAVRITVFQILVAAAAFLLLWMDVFTVLAAAALIGLILLPAAMFVSVCCGKAVEPWLVRRIPFLK